MDRREDVAPGQGQLKVITTRMRPGYLRKNGVPYSGNATLEEYFDRFTAPNGDIFLVVTMIVTDPQYLVEPYITNAHFKKIPDRLRMGSHAMPGRPAPLARMTMLMRASWCLLILLLLPGRSAWAQVDLDRRVVAPEVQRLTGTLATTPGSPSMRRDG